MQRVFTTVSVLVYLLGIGMAGVMGGVLYLAMTR